MRPDPKSLLLAKGEKFLTDMIEKTNKVQIRNSKIFTKEDIKMVVEAPTTPPPMEETEPTETIPAKRDHKLSESSSTDRISDDDDNNDGKPNHSYISLIANAILAAREKKLVLSDIYSYVLDNYSYFRNKGPGWRNSIRHNLSLNECFIKAGRSPNGKGHYWAINPPNYDDFSKGDFRRRRAQRRARRAMMAYGEFPDQLYSHWACHPYLSMQRHHPYSSYASSFPAQSYPMSSYYPPTSPTYHSTTCGSPSCYSPPLPKGEVRVIGNIRRKSFKRGFDVESLLKDDEDEHEEMAVPELIKLPSSTQFTPSLQSPPPSGLHRSVSSINNKEHFLFPEKHSSLSPSRTTFHNNGRYLSDVAIPSPSSAALLSIDRYRSFYSSSPLKSHYHHQILHRDLPRIPLVQ